MNVKRLKQKAAILNIVIYLMSAKNTNLKTKMNRYIDNIYRVKEYIDTHYSTKLTLDMLSSQAFLSKNYFRKVFCEIMEMSPQEYITHVRVANAIKMIRSGQYAYKDIACMCGFESQSYMNYVIKKRTGKTPSKFNLQQT